MDQIFTAALPHLGNPLVLAGLALLLLFTFFRSLIASKLLKPVSSVATASVLHQILLYGFVVAVICILGGFGLAFWQAYSQIGTSKKLNRLEAEDILQSNRGNIERCISQHDVWPSIEVLAFLFSTGEGGLGVDIFDALNFPKPDGGMDPAHPHAGVVIGSTDTQYIKVSVWKPELNQCLISRLTELKGFSGVENNKPFVHVIFTDISLYSTTRERKPTLTPAELFKNELKQD